MFDLSLVQTVCKHRSFMAAGALLVSLHAACVTAAPDESLSDSGRFGEIHLYQQGGGPQRLVLVISGDSGWQGTVADMARTLAEPGTLVAGIDLNNYRHGVSTSSDYCDYPAGELDALSHSLQRQYAFPDYQPPVLVGYAGGGTLAYAALAQSPENTFGGAISLLFDPRLHLTKSLCKGLGSLPWEWRKDKEGGGMQFGAAAALPGPWRVLVGDLDHAYDRKAAADFAGKIPQARLVRLPRTGHGYARSSGWLAQLYSVYSELLATAADQPGRSSGTGAPDDLPLVKIPAAADKPSGDLMALVISGDGGWADLDRDIAGALADRGVPVVGWDALHYFWSRRTPDSTGQDLARVLAYYLKTWHKSRVLLIGYSLGADVMPFMASRLPQGIRDKVAEVALLGISPSVDFEFRLSDWLPGSHAPAPYRTAPEVAKLERLNVLCLYGAEEDDSLCPQLDATCVQVRKLPGGHHFNGDYEHLADIILAAGQ